MKAKQRVISKYRYLDYTIEVAEDLNEMARLNLLDPEKAKFAKYGQNLNQKIWRFSVFRKTVFGQFVFPLITEIP